MQFLLTVQADGDYETTSEHTSLRWEVGFGYRPCHPRCHFLHYSLTSTRSGEDRALRQCFRCGGKTIFHRNDTCEVPDGACGCYQAKEGAAPGYDPRMGSWVPR